jgi:hypothetical protein
MQVAQAPSGVLRPTHGRLMVPLFGYRRQHRQPPHSKPASLDDHDGSLFEILAHPGNIRQENVGLLVRRHEFVGAQQHKRRRHRTLQSQQFAEVGVLGNEDTDCYRANTKIVKSVACCRPLSRT